MKKILFTMVVAVVFSTAIYAEMKIAYIDSDKIMMQSDATMEAQAILMEERQKWEAEVMEMDAQLEELVKDYQASEFVLTETGKKEAEDKINELGALRQQKVTEYFGENGKFFQKQNELLEPILTKLKNVIENISIDNNYSLVLDVASGGVLYGDTNLDITDEVLDAFNKAIE